MTKSKLVQGSILVLVFSLITTGSVIAQDAGLWGWVTDAQSQEPLAAHISVVHTQLPHAQFFHARVSSAGLFEMKNLPPGKKLLIARAEGYGFAWKEIDLGASGDTGPVSFALERAATIEGKVVNEQGQPVKGVTVEIAYDDLPPVVFEYMTGRVETDSHGAFRIRGVASNRDFYLELSHPSFLARLSEREFRVQPAEARQLSPIALHKGITLSGQVLDTMGQPVPNSDISLVATRLASPLPAGYKGLGMTRAMHHTSRTGTDGRFRIEGIPDGKYRLLAHHPQYVLYHQMIECDQSVSPSIEVDIRPQRKTN